MEKNRPRETRPAPHTAEQYSAAARAAYKMLGAGCNRKDIIAYTGIPDAHVRKMMTTEHGKAQAAAVLEIAGKPVDIKKISRIQTGEMGPENFAKCLIKGRVRLTASPERLAELVGEYARKRP